MWLLCFSLNYNCNGPRKNPSSDKSLRYSTLQVLPDQNNDGIIDLKVMYQDGSIDTLVSDTTVDFPSASFYKPL